MTPAAARRIMAERVARAAAPAPVDLTAEKARDAEAYAERWAEQNAAAERARIGRRWVSGATRRDEDGDC